MGCACWWWQWWCFVSVCVVVGARGRGFDSLPMASQVLRAGKAPSGIVWGQDRLNVVADMINGWESAHVPPRAKL